MHNIGDLLQVDIKQAAIMLGCPTDKLSAGAKGDYHGMGIEIADIKGNDVQLRRIAYDSATHNDTPTEGNDPHQFHPLQHFEDPSFSETEKGGGGGFFRAPILGPIEKKVLHPGEQKSGDSVGRTREVHPNTGEPLDHPPHLTNPQYGEPILDYRMRSSTPGTDEHMIIQGINEIQSELNKLNYTAAQRMMKGDYMTLARDIAKTMESMDAKASQVIRQIGNIVLLNNSRG